MTEHLRFQLKTEISNHKNHFYHTHWLGEIAKSGYNSNEGSYH